MKLTYGVNVVSVLRVMLNLLCVSYLARKVQSLCVSSVCVCLLWESESPLVFLCVVFLQLNYSVKVFLFLVLKFRILKVEHFYIFDTFLLFIQGILWTAQPHEPLK